MSRINTAIALIAALVMLSTAGCGFQLRGTGVEATVESFYITGSSRHFLRTDLTRSLQRADVAEAASATEAAVVVELLNERRNRRNVSTTGAARVAEYELEMSVEYRLTDSVGKELAPAQWLTRERIFRVDRNNVVGTSEEQSLLEREMRSDLVQSIIRAINAVTRSAGAAAS